MNKHSAKGLGPSFKPKPKHDTVPPQSAPADKKNNPQLDSKIPADVEPAKEHKEPTSEYRPDQTPAWKIALEAAAALIGIGVLVVYALQLNQMIESNRLNRDALIAVQRAFVSMKEISSIELVAHSGKKEPTTVEFRTAFENSGATTARRVVSFFSVSLVPFDELDKFKFEPGRRYVSLSAIGPKSVVYSDPVRKERALLENRPPGEVYVFWGFVTYFDVFTKEMRLTEFCQYLGNTYGFTANPGAMGFDYISCPAHNCTDRDCGDWNALGAAAYYGFSLKDSEDILKGGPVNPQPK